MTGEVLTLTAGLVLGALVSAASADEPSVYRGSAEVVGPAMLSIDGRRIVLFGIDAPVRGQPCYARNCATAAGGPCRSLGRRRVSGGQAQHAGRRPIIATADGRASLATGGLVQFFMGGYFQNPKPEHAVARRRL
jgi:hypothetical protein